MLRPPVDQRNPASARTHSDETRCAHTLGRSGCVALGHVVVSHCRLIRARFTLDNRRLYCLQEAAVRPQSSSAHPMRALLSTETPGNEVSFRTLHCY
eukprot:807851-Amphidinium_carterae.1